MSHFDMQITEAQMLNHLPNNLTILFHSTFKTIFSSGFDFLKEKKLFHADEKQSSKLGNINTNGMILRLNQVKDLSLFLFYFLHYFDKHQGFHKGIIIDTKYIYIYTMV